jgi:hypothetical protein
MHSAAELTKKHRHVLATNKDLLGLKKEVSEMTALSKSNSHVNVINLDLEHFHAMISHFPDTHDKSSGPSNFAYNLYIQLTYGGHAMRYSESMQGVKHVPNGCFPEYVKYNRWTMQDADVGHFDNTYRVFLDSLCMREGYESAKAFSRAACNSILFIPILSCHEIETEGGKTEYAGSVGQMVDWDPLKEDRVDTFLVEIALANALMELPQEERWLQSVVPIFVGKGAESGFARFDMNVLEMLSSEPSINTNREVARRLIENGFQVKDEVLVRSIRDNIKLAACFQGINVSELGTARY